MNQSEKKKENLVILDKLKGLKDNWNTYGALPFDSDFIDSVKCIVDGLEIQPDIFPTGRQSIQLEYKKPNGDYLEFEIDSDYVDYLMIKNESTKEAIVSKDEMNNLITFFFE